MTWDMAASITNRKGQRYIDLDNEDLEHMLRSIEISINADQATGTPIPDDKMLKRDAIAVILAKRKQES
jgi:hypothetical protein